MELANFVRGGGLPVVTRTYRPQDLFLFSAATWNAHRVHYDQNYAVDIEGHQQLLVQGPLQAVHMFQVLIDSLVEAVSLRSVSYRHLSGLYLGQEASMSGKLVDVDVDATEGTATFDLWVERVEDGQRTTTGSATVQVSPAT